jgi:drug/metabolite transporter superfamily protein YnfA
VLRLTRKLRWMLYRSVVSPPGGFRPDRHDAIGGLLGLVGFAVMRNAQRTDMV